MELMSCKQGILTCDFEAIKARLNDQLRVYRNMVFTEEAKKDAKETVAQLRKEKKAFSDEVAEIKKVYMKPFDEFHAKAKELLLLYDEPIDLIADQIDAFEVDRIKAKRLRIAEIYEEMVPEEEWQAIIPLIKIQSLKWENSTFSEKAIKEEILDRKMKAKEAISGIKAFGSDKEAEAIAMYQRNFDLYECLTFLTNYEKQKKEIVEAEQERLKQETEARIRSEERAKIEAEQKHAEEIEKAKAETIEAMIPVENGSPAHVYSYDITLTEAQKEALEIYMNSIGIDYELIMLPIF